jgi:hypothetical protein
MRGLADEERIRQFMRELGRASRYPAQVYLTGGASAVLSGWRASTIDVDLLLVPDDDATLRAIAALKESLGINVELAAPSDFVPVRPGWQDRSPFVAQEGPLTFRHFDFEAQALAKVERSHAQDVADVREMLNRGLVTAASLRSALEAVAPLLYRYPAVDSTRFRQNLETILSA